MTPTTIPRRDRVAGGPTGKEAAQARVSAPTPSHYRFAAIAFLGLTAYGLMIPLRFRPRPWSEALDLFRTLRLTDFSIAEARGDWAASVVQFGLLGFLAMGALAVDRGRPRAAAIGLLLAPLGVVLALGLELLQIFFPPRTVNLNDPLLESLGFLIGIAAWVAAGPAVHGWCRRLLAVRGLDGIVRLALPAALVLLIAWQLMPFDLVVHPDELSRKWAEGRIRLLPFASWGELGLAGPLKAAGTAAVGLVLGVLAGLAGLRPSRALRAGLALFLGLEILQGFVLSRSADVTDVLAGLAGFVPGQGSAPGLRTLLERPRGIAVPSPWIAAGAVAWMVVLLAMSLQPFRFRVDPASFAASDADLSDEETTVFGLRRLTWAPFVDYYWGSKHSVVEMMATKALAFVPLGVLAALAWERRGGATGWGPTLLTLLLAALVGLVIEIGQYFLPERHPSTTDLLVQGAGAWMGLALAGHVLRALTAGRPDPRRSHEFAR